MMQKHHIHVTCIASLAGNQPCSLSVLFCALDGVFLGFRVHALGRTRWLGPSSDVGRSHGRL